MEFEIKTIKAQEFVNITRRVEKVVSESGIKDGAVYIFIPHTTAGITINENTDEDVVDDIIDNLNRVFPVRGDYRHFEGNSHAHIKASLMGSSCSIIIENGALKLGTWQGIFLCEFDGPRSRKVFIKVI